ncbi:MAG: hypothetical protein HKN68_00075 [Saprospiraceae bacterium]|nr:hypothetical protein [Saprospiraceae bacterium]
MKLNNLFLCTLTLLTLMGCSKGDTEEPVENKPVNQAPSIPILISPPANLECAYTSLNFEWNFSIDPENHEIEYKLEIAEKSDFNSLLFDIVIIDNFKSLNLEEGKTYYWRVLARDENQAESSYSEIWALFTEPKLTYNSIPQQAASENPVNNSNVLQGSVTLQWSCSDEDEDPLKFDLYFGPENPPTLYQQDLENPSYEVNLESNQTYYWKVVATDPQGAKSIGPTWTFDSN